MSILERILDGMSISGDSSDRGRFEERCQEARNAQKPTAREKLKTETRSSDGVDCGRGATWSTFAAYLRRRRERFVITNLHIPNDAGRPPHPRCAASAARA